LPHSAAPAALVDDHKVTPRIRTVTAELVAFARIVAAVGADPRPSGPSALPGQVGALVDDPEPTVLLAACRATVSRLVTVARGLLSGASEEIALKRAQTSRLLATAYSAADLRHGPIDLAPKACRCWHSPIPARRQLHPTGCSPRAGRHTSHPSRSGRRYGK
jgi:fructoselysine-6-P-deglycase FrlB-like protein